MEAQGRDPRHIPSPTSDPGAMRISDADRHRVSEVLREAAGEGRLELPELEERLEATYAAKTYADLVPITADLPVRHDSSTVPAPPPRRAATVAGPAYASSVAIMSETKRVGPWQVGARHSAFALMGSVLLDLREASLTGREVTVTANAVMGEVKILVDADMAVAVEGIGVMGEFSEQRPRVEPRLREGSPVIRVQGFALMGSVHVQRRGPSRPQRRLGR